MIVVNHDRRLGVDITVAMCCYLSPVSRSPDVTVVDMLQAGGRGSGWIINTGGTLSWSQWVCRRLAQTEPITDRPTISCPAPALLSGLTVPALSLVSRRNCELLRCCLIAGRSGE